MKNLRISKAPKKAFSEHNPETVENMLFFRKKRFFSNILSKQGDVFLDKMIARDLRVYWMLGILRHSQAVSYAFSFFWLDGFAVPAPAQVTQAVQQDK